MALNAYRTADVTEVACSSPQTTRWHQMTQKYLAPRCKPSSQGLEPQNRLVSPCANWILSGRVLYGIKKIGPLIRKKCHLV